MVLLVKLPLRIVSCVGSAVLPVEESVGVVIPVSGDDTVSLRRVPVYEEGVYNVLRVGRGYEVSLRWWWWLVLEVPVPGSVDGGLEFSGEGVKPAVGMKRPSEGKLASSSLCRARLSLSRGRSMGPLGVGWLTLAETCRLKRVR